MKKIFVLISIVTLGWLSMGYYTVKTCGELYGIFSVENMIGSCSCMNGYVRDINIFGNKSCVSGESYCDKNYGVFSKYDSVNGICSCIDGYYLSDDILGKKSCVSLNSYCTNTLGYGSRYNNISDSCECNVGYKLDKTSKGYTCTDGELYCHSNYGINSSYNRSTYNCECDKGYTLKNSKCEKKENNIYAYLIESRSDKKKILIGIDDNNDLKYNDRFYVLDYGIGCNLYIDHYIGKVFVLNLGVDKSIDYLDNIVLQNDKSTCSILGKEEVSNLYSLYTCQERFGKYTITNKDLSCSCKKGYKIDINNKCSRLGK